MGKRRRTLEPDDSAPTTAATKTVFVDTNLDTHFAVTVSNSDTVFDLKTKILFEHSRSFSKFGQINILSLKVKRGGNLYHLPDSVLVVSAFEETTKNWFLLADLQQQIGNQTSIKDHEAANKTHEAETNESSYVSDSSIRKKYIKKVDTTSSSVKKKKKKKEKKSSIPQDEDAALVVLSSAQDVKKDRKICTEENAKPNYKVAEATIVPCELVQVSSINKVLERGNDACEHGKVGGSKMADYNNLGANQNDRIEKVYELSPNHDPKKELTERNLPLHHNQTDFNSKQVEASPNLDGVIEFPNSGVSKKKKNRKKNATENDHDVAGRDQADGTFDHLSSTVASSASDCNLSKEMKKEGSNVHHSESEQDNQIQKEMKLPPNHKPELMPSEIGILNHHVVNVNNTEPDHSAMHQIGNGVAGSSNSAEEGKKKKKAKKSAKKQEKAAMELVSDAAGDISAAKPNSKEIQKEKPKNASVTHVEKNPITDMQADDSKERTRKDQISAMFCALDELTKKKSGRDKKIMASSSEHLLLNEKDSNKQEIETSNDQNLTVKRKPDVSNADIKGSDGKLAIPGDGSKRKIEKVEKSVTNIQSDVQIGDNKSADTKLASSNDQSFISELKHEINPVIQGDSFCPRLISTLVDSTEDLCSQTPVHGKQRPDTGVHTYGPRCNDSDEIMHDLQQIKDLNGKQGSYKDQFQVVNKKPANRNEGVLKGSQNGKMLLTTPRGIFGDDVTESSSDEDHMEDSDARSTGTASDHSYSSDHSKEKRISNTNSPSSEFCGTEGKEYGGKRNASSCLSGPNSVSMDVIFRSSNRFKKAKSSACQPALEDNVIQQVEYVSDS